MPLSVLFEVRMDCPDCTDGSGTSKAPLIFDGDGNGGSDQAPQPSDHVLAQLKAGETVYQAGELPKTLRVSKTHYELPKTVCKTPFASIFPPSMENGDGTRQGAAVRVEEACEKSAEGDERVWQAAGGDPGWEIEPCSPSPAPSEFPYHRKSMEFR